MYALHIVQDNDTEGYRFGDHVEDIEDYLLKDDGTPDTGAIYRIAQREYGRCAGSVYIDKVDGGKPDRVGWYFVKRLRYEDTGEPFIMGTWITVVERIVPAPPTMRAIAF